MLHPLTPLLVASLLLILRPICAVASAAQSTKCLALKHSLHLENTTILNVTYVAAPTNVSTPGVCQSSAPVSAAPLCRVQFIINTTATSAVHAETWLPDTWFGRFLGLGNGGLGGCIDYPNLDYGASLHFAAIGSDNGHDGGLGSTLEDGHQFLHHPEVINDFAFRAVHVEVLIGKQRVSHYYGPTAKIEKSYYLGCSTGGRQGTLEALRFPEDFDGIVAGAPATDYNHAAAWAGILTRYIGAPFDPAAPPPQSLPPALWAVVSACVRLPSRSNPVHCQQQQQHELLDSAAGRDGEKIFTPLFGSDGQLVYPRYSPGGEADPLFQAALSTGDFFIVASDWSRFAIYNDTEHDFSNFGLDDIPFWDSINPGGIATFDGDLSAFRNGGGKFLTYHGRRDPILPSTNSKRVYDLISHTLSLPLLDDFYRLFLIPGMGHCSGGLGAPSFGQSGGLNVVNDTSHNILLALVDWVERGVAPDTIVGSGENGTTRTHCRYPMRSVFNGSVFVCEG
ncbi:tannase and feruloyl esterase [Mycena vulgaris]|nr:tannase and feruloyl esterase [Mycena vulgaris]